MLVQMAKFAAKQPIVWPDDAVEEYDQLSAEHSRRIRLAWENARKVAAKARR